MKTLILLVATGVLSAGLVHAQQPTPAPAVDTEKLAPKITTPPGPYQLVHLSLANGTTGLAGTERSRTEKVPLVMLVGFRDGQATMVWFQSPFTMQYWPLEKTLTLTGTTLKGQIAGHTGGAEPGGGPNHERYTVEIDATVTGGVVTGTYKHTLALKTPLEFTGAVTGKLVTGQPLAAGQDWPHYFGAADGHRFEGPKSGAKLITDLAQAKPLWKSEAWILTAFGNAPDARYSHTAAGSGLGGGASSPVVSGGRVFQYHYEPNTTLSQLSTNSPYSPWKNDPALKEKMMQERFPNLPLGRQWWSDFWRLSADDVVTCLDAATGQTLWQVVLPMRNANVQTHKLRGYQPVPLVRDGVVYVGPNYMGRVYAFEASTGKLLWEQGATVTGAEQVLRWDADNASSGPSLEWVDGMLLVPSGHCALDAKTGKLLWQIDQYVMAPYLPVTVADKTQVLRPHGVGGTSLSSINLADGKPLWTHEKFPTYDRSVYPLVIGDRLVTLERLTKFEGQIPGVSDSMGILHCFRVKADGLEPLWSAPCPQPVQDSNAMAANATHVYVDGAKDLFCYDLATGQVVAKLAGIGGSRTQIMMLSEDRVLVTPEGRHGVQYFAMATSDPKDMKLLVPTNPLKNDLGQTWVPPHPPTTAYANQPLNYPLVDGRLFVRGRDGIYCYDLRESKKP